MIKPTAEEYEMLKERLTTQIAHQFDSTDVLGRPITKDVLVRLRDAVIEAMKSLEKEFPILEAPRMEVRNIKAQEDGTITYDYVPLNEAAKAMLEGCDEHRVLELPKVLEFPKGEVKIND